ncbi:putative LysM domain-containing protein [Lupinus albus]|uniref:Putative LysM domain-containing protein n=1 Tax=Lupinus albus TaxID=3870 RepID=A0A6A4NC08_LUPAL|nr:putative LysM domain-containing protein [Lupinus albus]
MSPSNVLQSNGGGGGGNGLNYIEHQVSKLDTLAGVAIKYGVEVADIKRMNGLASDLQMFAVKTLRIPLPGRHPPSRIPSLPNGHAKQGDDSFVRRSPPRSKSGMKEPFQSSRLKAPKQELSPAMTILQKYYGLRSLKSTDTFEGTEMAAYTSVSSDHSSDEWLPKASPILDFQSDNYPKSTNLVYDLLTGNNEVPEYVPLSEIGDVGGEKSDEKSVRRRQKAEVDGGDGSPERILKEGNSSGSSNGFSSTGKPLSGRTKSASRAVLFPESESGWLDSIAVGLGESILTNGFSGVRKSSSAMSLREQERNNSATVWPPRWSLKPDLQAAISKPIFDGLPIPITARRGKTALD